MMRTEPMSQDAPLPSVFRHLRLLGAMLKIRLGRQMMYRASFWTAFFVDGTLFIVQLAIFSTLFLNVDSVNGWSRAQNGLLCRHVLHCGRARDVPVLLRTHQPSGQESVKESWTCT